MTAGGVAGSPRVDLTLWLVQTPLSSYPYLSTCTSTSATGPYSVSVVEGAWVEEPTGSRWSLSWSVTAARSGVMIPASEAWNRSAIASDMSTCRRVVVEGRAWRERTLRMASLPRVMTCTLERISSSS